MLTNANDSDQLRAETVKLACTILRSHGHQRTPPKVKVRITSKRACTGRCVNKDRITLSVPKGASVPQALALICHEVAHWLAPSRAYHGKPWREALNECLATYEAELPEGDLGGTKNDVHIRARQALAKRLDLLQASAADPDEEGAPTIQKPLDDHKRDKVLRQVAQCLKLAEHAGSEHEASTAALIATRLLRTYRLSLEDVTQAERDRDDPLVNRYICQGTAKKVNWRVRLGFDLASALGCYALSFGRRWCKACGKHHAQMSVFGRQSAVDVYEHIYIYLLREINNLGREATRKYSRDRENSGYIPGQPLFTEDERRGRFLLIRVLAQGDTCPFCGLADHDYDSREKWLCGHDRQLFSKEEYNARQLANRKWEATPKAWGAAFRLGAVSSAVEKLRMRREQEQQDQARREAEVCEEHALELVRQDYQEAQEYAYAIAGHMISGTHKGTGGRSSQSGHAAGRQAGQSIHVGHVVRSAGDGLKQITG